MTQFETTMEKLGVTEIDAQGKKFDPAYNAVMHVEDAEKGENEIVEVFQKGFTMGDKVIRFCHGEGGKLICTIRLCRLVI